LATDGTARAFRDAGIAVQRINKVKEGRPHIVDSMKNGEIDLVLNTSSGASDIADSRSLRQTAVANRIPYYTTVAGARATVAAILAMDTDTLEVAPLQSYFHGSY
jgi:carbamoyl-phosphate synthase large subunit